MDKAEWIGKRLSGSHYKAKGLCAESPHMVKYRPRNHQEPSSPQRDRLHPQGARIHPQPASGNSRSPKHSLPRGSSGTIRAAPARHTTTSSPGDERCPHYYSRRVSGVSVGGPGRPGRVYMRHSAAAWPQSQLGRRTRRASQQPATRASLECSAWLAVDGPVIPVDATAPPAPLDYSATSLPRGPFPSQCVRACPAAMPNQVQPDFREPRPAEPAVAVGKGLRKPDGAGETERESCDTSWRELCVTPSFVCAGAELRAWTGGREFGIVIGRLDSWFGTR